MRRLIKEQLLELITTLKETQLLIEECILNGDDLTNLLADQQEGAIVIGNQIEEAEGDGTKAVQLLEKYCEVLWQMSQSTEAVLLLKQKEQVYELLTLVEKELAGLSEQLVVVFLPYKASMWDSMESVWQAVCEDEKYIPIVMPIPYFELKDGQVIGQCYEGDKFPEYVPVTDFNGLSLESLQPDIIFIHNPFDNYNKVTSVWPQFYSDRLKRVARRLVYIPYFFVSWSTVPTIHREFPSYKYVDFIVTQCREMINTYAGWIPKEKFLPCGSPIVDKIIRLNCEKPPIPEEWKPMLPNGKDFADKKVVMLNTSISLLVKEKERFLNKIAYIFYLVKEMPEILLVWRPHPLLKATVETLGDRYAKYLEDLEDRFLEEKLGVLDKTSDVGVTVALCDAYLGELASSVISMFGIAGKPRFYINTRMPKMYERTVEYLVSGYCKTEETEFFLVDNPGWIVIKKRGMKELIPLTPIPGREYISGRAFGGMELKNDSLWIYPENAEGILIYNVATGKMKKVFMENDVIEEQTEVYRQAAYQIRKINIAADSECHKMIRAQLLKDKMKLRKSKNEWFEDEGNCLKDYLHFLVMMKKEELIGETSVYSTCLANLDGSCGRKVIQAVEESLNEE